MSMIERPREVRHCVSGTGLEVWEVVRSWIEVGYDRLSLQLCYPDLTPAQLEGALRYAREHEGPILDRIREDYTYVPEHLAHDIPVLPEHLPGCVCGSGR